VEGRGVEQRARDEDELEAEGGVVRELGGMGGEMVVEGIVPDGAARPRRRIARCGRLLLR